LSKDNKESKYDEMVKDAHGKIYDESKMVFGASKHEICRINNLTNSKGTEEYFCILMKFVTMFIYWFN